MMRWRRFAVNERVIAAVYAFVTLFATAQKAWHHSNNNLRIYRASFWNLISGTNLYALHPAQHADYFKYSPTFALMMAPFAVLPELASALVWNLCNVFALFAAVQLLPIAKEKRTLVLWLVLIELVISIENFQSNAFVAALIIATFIAFECDSPELAGVFVALSASIKIFGAAAAVLVLFYPRKRRFAVATMSVLLLLAALPLCVTSFATLADQYRNWLNLLRADYVFPEKLSVMAWLHAWFGVNWGNKMVQATGLLLMLLPLIRLGKYGDELFRLHFLSALLIFLVIFNHKAESPMFIVAVTGVALWFVTSTTNFWRIALAGFVLLFTSLASTDVVPRHVREMWMTPFAIKVFPCIAAWIVIEAELLLRRDWRRTA